MCDPFFTAVLKVALRSVCVPTGSGTVLDAQLDSDAVYMIKLACLVTEEKDCILLWQWYL